MTRKRSLLDEIDRARSEAARKVRFALANLDDVRSAIEADSVDKTVVLRLLKQSEDALQEVEIF